MYSLSLTIPLLALSSFFCWGEEEEERVFRTSFVSLIPGVKPAGLGITLCEEGRISDHTGRNGLI